jgi:glucose/mannose transport system permease protein
MTASALPRHTAHALRRRSFTRLAIYATLIFWAIIYLIPIYLVLNTSLKPRAEVSLDQVWALPRQVSADAFVAAVEKLSPNFANSIILTVPATLLSAIIGSLNGYVLSKWRFRGANIVFPLMLFGMFIPYQSVLIPLFQLMSQLRLTGTLWSLILTHVVYGLPITTLIFRNYYAEIPDELIEAGQIDGANFFTTVHAGRLSALAARLRGRDHLAVHADLERVSVRRDARRSAHAADHGRAQPAGRRTSY